MLQGHSRGINSVAFSPDGLRIVSDSNDKNYANLVIRWRGASGLQYPYWPRFKRCSVTKWCPVQLTEECLSGQWKPASKSYRSMAMVLL
mmetsp:Transcript_20318/g.64922  ORF Transcript_20318/g.64922 Transcript_20318/m.64922 type:complete len:89 (-) Transcript_20318:261-527(-)